MILNCNVRMFVAGMEPDVSIMILKNGKCKEYTKESIPKKYLDLDACIKKLDNGYLISVR